MYLTDVLVKECLGILIVDALDNMVTIRTLSVSFHEHVLPQGFEP